MPIMGCTSALPHHACMLRGGTGTSIEDRTGGGSVEAEFRRDVEPRLMARPDLWPAPYNTLQEFIRVAGAT
jgi:hypothetical protein